MLGCKFHVNRGASEVTCEGFVVSRQTLEHVEKELLNRINSQLHKTDQTYIVGLGATEGVVIHPVDETYHNGHVTAGCKVFTYLEALHVCRTLLAAMKPKDDEIPF